MSRAIIATHHAASEVAKLRSTLAPLGLSVVRGTRDLDGTVQACDGGCTAALVDLDEPGVESDVARLRARFPGIAVIATAKRPRGEVLLRAARLGADGILRWPAAPATVERLTRRRLEAPGAAGTCRGIPSADLLALHLRAGEDGVLVFWRDDGADFGCFHLEGGQVIHATAGRRVGADAAREVLSWPDAQVRWLPGRTGAPRTILGNHPGLFRPSGTATPAATMAVGDADLEGALSVAFPQVVAKMAKIAAMPQVVGAFLLVHGEVTHGAAAAGVDEAALRRAVQAAASTLAEIAAAVPLSDSDPVPTEVQATAAGIRIIVDRVGPAEAGVQAGVAVYQAASISKSLRRLIRQVDRAFHRALARARADADRVA